MQYKDIVRLINGGIPLRYPKESFAADDGYLSIDNKIALPVYRVPPSITGGPDIPIVKENGTHLGTLCLCTRIPDTDPALLTDDQYVSYLTELDIDEIGARHTFRHDYVVLDAGTRAHYAAEYELTSGLWGGYVHCSDAFPIPRGTGTPTVQISARKNLAFPTTHHHEGLYRSIQEQYAFERYLKLYHLMELIVDWRFVEKIKGLGADLAGISSIMSQYSTEDLQKLKTLLSETITNAAPIATVLDKVALHLSVATKVFFDFGKKGNPIGDLSTLTTILENGGFGAKPLRFVVEVAAYWVFRIRCSVAHSRIGEYVMTLNDEEFVVDFGEPLLRALLLQVFSK